MQLCRDGGVCHIMQTQTITCVGHIPCLHRQAEQETFTQPYYDTHTHTDTHIVVVLHDVRQPPPAHGSHGPALHCTAPHPGPGRASVVEFVPHTFAMASLDKLHSNHSLPANGMPPWATSPRLDIRRPAPLLQARHSLRAGFSAQYWTWRTEACPVSAGTLMSSWCRTAYHKIPPRAPLPVGSSSPGLPRPAYTQHEEADTGQTNRRPGAGQCGVGGWQRQRSFCAIIRRRIQTGHPHCQFLHLAVQAQTDHQTA
jgi:hypothetical protein